MAGGNIGDAMQVKLRGNILSFLVTSGQTIYRGSAVAINTSTGTVVSAGDDANRRFVGIAEEKVVGDGTKRIRVRRRGVFKLRKESDSVAATEIGDVVCAQDNQTSSQDQTFESLSAASNDVVVGIVVGVDLTADRWWVDIIAAGFENYNMSSYTTTTVLASTGNGNGAALIGAEVTGGVAKFSGSDVQAILAELGVDIASAQAFIPIPLCNWRLEDGGVITGTPSGAAPGFQQSGNEELVLEWGSDSNPGEIVTNIMVPPDLDSSADFILHILAFGCAADSPVFTVQAFSPVMAAAINSDDDFGVDSTELTAGAVLKEITSTMLATNIAAAPSVITLIINPKDGQLGSNSLLLYGTWIEYTRKILTS